VNGQAANVPLNPGTYASLRRNWKAGDRIQLELAMPVELMESHPLVEETRNQVAVKRGPMVYCLETPGLPAGVKINDVALTSNGEYKPRVDGELLGGVAAIETEAVVRPAGDWRGRLYRPLQSAGAKREKVVLTPYFAWANRGPAEMSVWLPLAR
jgi:DUF1680 family protein